jgi:hypothetical protein
MNKSVKDVHGEQTSRINDDDIVSLTTDLKRLSISDKSMFE